MKYYRRTSCFSFFMKGRSNSKSNWNEIRSQSDIWFTILEKNSNREETTSRFILAGSGAETDQEIWDKMKGVDHSLNVSARIFKIWECRALIRNRKATIDNSWSWERQNYCEASYYWEPWIRLRKILWLQISHNLSQQEEMMKEEVPNNILKASFLKQRGAHKESLPHHKLSNS